MEKLTVMKNEEGVNIALQVNDSAGSGKDCSSFTTYKLQVWEPGLDPDTSANLTVDATMAWNTAVTGDGYYAIANGDFAVGRVYMGRVYLAKTGVVEIPKIFMLAIGWGTWYCTVPELKSELDITGDEEDDILEAVCEEVRYYIDNYCDRTFVATTATRYFDGSVSPLYLDDDIISVTSLSLDEDSDATYEASLTEDTDYRLYPLNTTPKTYIKSMSSGSYSGFAAGVDAGVKIVGSWGYDSTTPKPVRRAAKILAARMYKRKDTAFATIKGSPETGVVEVHHGLDADVQLLLSHYRKMPSRMT